MYINNVKYLILLFMIFELIILSIHMFSQGFLLKRDALTNKSKCSDFSIPCIKNKNNCSLPKVFKKSILLIIDALRYDFVASDKKFKEKWPHNKIHVINQLMQSQPQRSRLFKFIADPPTTTMQRLKGLTTGSLPTFIDASHNFASSEIFEDNLIDQMINSGKKVVALGDDTWGDLYPNRFFRSHLFPSFNVMDLDSVDNGIQNHIYDEIKSADWDVIIAHFLGVDHCGHRYGPSHSQMEVKLKQMNEVIRNVTKLINNDTLLIVMGDHGMTSTGDHGGDAKDEIETVLFMYSPGYNLPAITIPKISESVSQIDLVPTLATLLGIPIPFSNLGKVIKEAIDLEDKNNCSYLDSLYLNYQQVHKYLNTYQNMNNEFPENIWKQLQTLSSSFETDELNSRKERQLVHFLDVAKAMCEEIWAKFNIITIIYGLSSLASVLVVIFIVLCNSQTKSILYHFKYVFVLFLFVNIFYFASYIFSQKGLNVIICLILIVFNTVFFESILPLKWNSLSVIIVLLISIGSFSNSFVIMEDIVSSFLFISFVCLLAGNILLKRLRSNPKLRSQKLLSNFSASDILLFSCLIVLILSVRMSGIFYKCREEQHWCDPSSLVHVPLNGLSKEFHNARYFTSLLSLVLLILAPQKWLQRCGNLNGYQMNFIIAKFFPILSGLFISGYWALQSVPSIPGNISRIAIYLPQLVYIIMVMGILVVLYNPLFVYVLPSTANNVVDMTGAQVIPQLFRKLKQTYEHRSPHSRKTPVVYGLATSVSAPLIVFLTLIALSIVVIAGDGMVPGVLLLIATGVFGVIFHSFLFWDRASSKEILLSPNYISIVMWFVLSIHGFYATGHQATFPTLNWAAAFVGYDGSSSYLIPAVLVIVNTFSSHLLFGIALPLLLVVPLSVSFLWPAIKKDKALEDAGVRGEFLLVERPIEAREGFVSIALIYIFLHSFKVFVTSVAAFILRRHLMVWKIFAPHFIFEVVGLMVSCVGVIVGLVFVFRVLSVLDGWSKKL